MATPSKSKVFEDWMEWLNRRGLDWGEPCCWACGRHWGEKYCIDNPQASREEIIDNWNNVPLQICHIIPRQFGGEDDPINLFLMCSDCHDKAPNTRSREAFLEWVEKQDYYADLGERLERELKNFGLDARLEEVNAIMVDEQLKKELLRSVGLHMNQARGGSQITLSSIVAVLAEKLNSKLTEY
ncbi:HNH endonuclease [Paenibacillus sp. 1011MAR3C5]|uniref:HNH endonuclease n=1 Tax=Paenibacillus sp. 1011MAR3C5 TaxID=1675787 RepID=UPI000E6C6B66|nr:HNH endonuclease [Paenibacillus sp. 1011MAR3C5]RJE91209.1 HNH endonuclease [Paenibacillus sp. 1011MAR3C5]